ncbi:TlyA family RNA methyltransferase [Caulobacter sp. 17J65-9]|uniref:TlyA family RNA methyltransferase n=1 Tax=Caulobacter sp. 17J65-9 TaxID=2709382 RepID=UPI0013C568D9|nr:TlyA family RNA methyltransferase [Caulobacter sp. 17J65-9]NEX93938.1 TlyA family RNA methyltransferase [Caulobacter sp. 17J65-9]
MTRKRLDVLLVERGLFDSRAKARAAIEAGGVRVAGRVVGKASEAVDPEAEIAAEPAYRWVGRGALKLDHALGLWPVEVEGRVVLDVGASTGGFTEVALSRGARRVYAVDVGRGQLHASLSADPRVVSLEGTDARALDRTLIPEAPELVVCDASFIGLAKVLAVPLELAAEGADLVALVKPQFEAGPEHVGKGGVVKDPTVHARVLDEVRAWLEARGWRVLAVADSPITGADGNREHLLWARLG